MKKYLVTGAAGFIGSHFVHMLLEREPDACVTGFDKLTYAGDPQRLEGLKTNSRFAFIEGDVASLDATEMAVDGVQAVFHFAAETHVDRSLLNADDFFRSNAAGTQVLLRAAKEAGITRFVHISTDEVYGSIASGSFRETDPVAPTNPYSVSKAAAEFLVLNSVRHDGIDAVITRGSNTYGPYQYPEKVIPLFVSNLLRGQKVPLYGDGMNERNWLHVADHCGAVYHVYQKGAAGGIYNIDGNRPLPNIELTKRVLSLLGRGEDSIEYVQDRKGHDRRYSLDGSKLTALGWSHRMEFDRVFPEVIEWYRENQAWLDTIRAKKTAFDEYYEKQYVRRKG